MTRTHGRNEDAQVIATRPVHFTCENGTPPNPERTPVRMKTYYAIVGLAGLAVCFYLTNTAPYPPPWAAFLLGYVPGTLLGLALMMYLKERHRP